MAEISDAFEDLAQAFRVLLEADWRANSQGLLNVDRAEAVGNIEIALAAALNAFHSLCDSMKKEDPASPSWYGYPELATVLLLRNARHHNKAKKIRTLYSFHAQEAEDIGRLQLYVLVDFPAGEEGGTTFDVYLSWADLKTLLSMPQSESMVRPDTAKLVAEYLGVDRFRDYAVNYELNESQVFFNLVPLLVNAAITVLPLIKSALSPESSESKIFVTLFDDMPHSNTEEPDVICGPFAFVK